MESLGMTSALPQPDFWNGKRVLVTGHTGFKGGWLTLWLASMNARVFGFSLPPTTRPSMYELSRISERVQGGIGDLRDAKEIRSAVENADPDIVLHLAAQPLVLEAYRDPVATFQTNVTGTVHLLDALRDAPSVRAILVVTTDKVYRNDNSGYAFREGDALGGDEPYAASKSATEMIASAYSHAYFQPRGVALATARGGNVIGGGDFAQDRIVPDIYRAIQAGERLVLRNPDATRPWQHVIDCLAGYICYAERLALGIDVPHALNFGPSLMSNVPVVSLVNAMQTAFGQDPEWRVQSTTGPVEAKALSLNSDLARKTLGWNDLLVGHAAIAATADWYLALARGDDMHDYTCSFIANYMRDWS